MNSLLIKNGKVVFTDSIRTCDLLVCDGKICDTDFRGELPNDCKVIDTAGAYVSPGFVDIHVHGGGGYDFMDCTPEALKSISDIHLQNGTTSLLPTAVSSEFENIIKLIETYKSVNCPNFFGIHLEGPYISKKQKGAHKEHLLHSPTPEETERLISVGEGIIKRITAAPELDGMDVFAERMISLGVNMSIGHTDATSDIALKSFDRGFSHVTHLYSATPSVRKINEVVKAGVIEAAYLDDRVSVELITDGRHAAIDALRLAVKIKGRGKVAFVSDALRPAGTDVKESYLGEKIEANRVIIEDGVAKLPDRSSFAGSIATGSLLLNRGINHYGFSLIDTVYMMTKSPAEIMGLKNKGEIKVGFDADIAVFDKDCNVISVILNGKIVK